MVFYASRHDVKSALDFAETARNNDQIDRALASATRSINGMTHRIFHPVEAEYTFREAPTRWRLWLGNPELVELASLVIGGTSITVGADVHLYPFDGPPYELIELATSAATTYPTRTREERAIVADGTWGYRDDRKVAELASGISDSDTTIVTDKAGLSVGLPIRVGDERMTITAERYSASGQTTTADLDADMADTSVLVADTSDFQVSETILIGSESMLIVAIGDPDTLIVRRSWDGSVLAAHSSGATIRSLRTFDVDRGDFGTDAASASSGDDVLRAFPPDLVHQLAIAEAIDKVLQESAGYARTSGSGDNEREMRANALRSLRHDVYVTHGRKVRTEAV